MLGRSKLVAFVATTDIGRARAFYGKTLGLSVIEESPFAVVFDANGTALRVTLVESLNPAGFTVLGWKVDDIAAEIGSLTSSSVAFEFYESMEQDGLGIWTTPGGDRVAWFKDPDGNILSLTQYRR